jgi:hypothetical protein
MYWFIRLRSNSFGDAERNLDEIARLEGYSVDELVELVRVHEDTMDAMKVSIPFPAQFSTTVMYFR